MRTTQTDDLIEAYVISHATEEMPLSALRISQETGIHLTDAETALRDLTESKVLCVRAMPALPGKPSRPGYYTKDMRTSPDASKDVESQIEAAPPEQAEFKAKCGAVLPSERGRNIHQGLCKKCKAGKQQPVKSKEKPKCRHCGEPIDPRLIERHEIACARKCGNKKAKEIVEKVEPIAEREVKEVLDRKHDESGHVTVTGPTGTLVGTWRPDPLSITPSTSIIIKGSVTNEPVTPKPHKRYSLEIHFDKILVDRDELESQISGLLAHGVKEITIKEVRP